MVDEFIPSKIRTIIASKDATNNFLALTLLRSQLGLDFLTAFAKLKLIECPEEAPLGMSAYQVPILTYRIIFLVAHQWNEDAAYPYLAIQRQVKQQEKNLEHYQKAFSVLFFESENERDIYEALIALPNLGEGLENLFF